MKLPWMKKKGYGPDDVRTEKGIPIDEHQEIDPMTGQQKDYLVLIEKELSKGYIRPVRRSYTHLKCGNVTTMGESIARTYARDPSFYGGTFCAHCGGHFPIGANGEFVWLDSDEKVGT